MSGSGRGKESRDLLSLRRSASLHRVSSLDATVTFADVSVLSLSTDSDLLGTEALVIGMAPLDNRAPLFVGRVGGLSFDEAGAVD